MLLKATIFLLFVALVNCEGEKAAPASDEQPATPETTAAPPTEENGVLVLTNDNFDATVKAKKFLLVEFYAPWCGHCKDLAPKYEAAAQQLAARDPPVTGILAKVDATVETKVAERFSVSGYPTLKFFRDGADVGEFDGDRSTQGIVSYVLERADPNYKPPPPAAITLTEANFDETIAKNDYILVEFFAPWCGHCKSLAPEYEKAAKILAQEDPPIPMAMVDATKEASLGTKFGVTGYPTLKLFKKGKPVDYKGPRHANGIVEYLIKNRKDAAVAVESLAEFQKGLQDFLPTIIGYFPDPNHEMLKHFIAATNDLREDFNSMLTLSDEVVKKVGLRPASFAIMMPQKLGSKFETESQIFDKADASVKDITDFIQDNSFPLVGHFSAETSKFYDASVQKRHFCLVFYSVDFSFDYRKVTQMWRSKIAEIANQFKDRVRFAVANDEQQEERLRALGLGETGTDMNVGCVTTDGTKFPMPEMDEYDADQITEFVKDVLAGKAKPHIKSQPIPARQTGPVTVVVGNSFKQVVTDSPNDVLIEFYAPWCGHCKNLEPTYARVAKRLSHIKTLTIAKIDATANDAPGYQVSGFPTFYFKPSGSSVATKMEGGRSEEDIIAAMAMLAKDSKAALDAEVAKDKKEKKDKKDEL